jgi:hypothetical protein
MDNVIRQSIRILASYSNLLLSHPERHHRHGRCIVALGMMIQYIRSRIGVCRSQGLPLIVAAMLVTGWASQMIMEAS